MIRIRVETAEGPITCDHQDGETLLGTLQRNGIHLPAPCGGLGKCGKCAVAVSDEAAAGPRAQDEEKFAPAGSGIRLACRVIPVANLGVTLPDSVEIQSDDSTAKGGTIEVPASGVPVVCSVAVTLAPPSLADQRSVHRRLLDEVKDATVSLAAVRDAAGLMGDLETPLDAAGLVVTDSGGDRLIGVDGEVTDQLPALAIDIGTTTIAAYLIDLSRRQVMAVRSEQNNQGRFGADVIGRISAVADGNDLAQVVRDQISTMTGALTTAAGLPPDAVLAAAVVGNPTMVHLLLGLDPAAIGRAPFMPLSVELLRVPMASLGLPGHPEARMIVAPGLSAYVGADIVADILASGINTTDELSLLIDIGTNGEMVLGDARGLLACSTAAGPAFEGANITNGSGGIPGAIDSVQRSGDQLIVGTIGDEPARTICGTGLLDLVALLLEDGIVDETGRLDSDLARTLPAYRERVTTIDGEDVLLITEPGEPERVILTQGDLRQVQLAKGAIAAGVRTLLDEAGVDPADLARVYLAGGFGTYVRPESALRIGLLPALPPERVVAIGNAAGAGAALLLADREMLAAAYAVVESSRYIELSRSQSFQMFFMEEMLFP